VLRLMMSRLGSHVCPNGHRVERSDSGIGMEIICPTCGVTFERPGAETFAFNSYGACPACEGLGVRTEVNVDALVPDQDKTLEKGAVLSWNSGGRRLSMYAAGSRASGWMSHFGLSQNASATSCSTPLPKKRQVTVTSERTGRTVQLTVNYDNAVAAAQRMLRSESARTRQTRRTIYPYERLFGLRRHADAARSACVPVRGSQHRRGERSGSERAFRVRVLASDGLPMAIARMTDGLLTEFEAGSFRCSTSALVISRSTGQGRRSRPENASGSSSLRLFERTPPACSTCSTSRRWDFTRAMSRASSGPFTRWL